MTEQKKSTAKKVKCIVLKPLRDFDGSNHKVGDEVSLTQKHFEYFNKVKAVKKL